MRHSGKGLYRLLLCGILSLVLLAGCGAGGGDGTNPQSGDGGESGGSESNTSSTVTVIPTQTTDSNGDVSIAISNTSKLSVTVNDTSSGSPIPISGLNVNITTDNGNYYIYLNDPSGVIPPLPIAFNINNVNASSTKSIAKISAGEALSCGLQASKNIFWYGVSILGEEIKVLVYLLQGKNILSIIENAPIAFEGTSNFQRLDDNSLTSSYLCQCTLKEATQALKH